jgi:hypothetical protein
MRITKSRLIEIIKEEVEKALLGEEEQTPEEEREEEGSLANFTKDIRSTTKALLDRDQVKNAMQSAGEELSKYRGRDKAEVLAALADDLGIDPEELAVLAKQIDAGVSE